MTLCGIALTLVLLAAQDDLGPAIRALAEKLSKEGLSGRLAEATASDAGVQAIQEKIDFLLAARISRFERDTTGHFEDYLFTTDGNGDLQLRPDRKPEIDALVRRLPLASRAMSGFSRRADDIVRRLGDTPMDRRAKAAWSDPGFRTAFFHRHPSELRELDDAELLDAVGFRGLERGKDDKLRVAGPFAPELRGRMSGIVEQLEAVKKYEKSYLKLVTQVNDGTARASLASDACALFLVGRVIRQVTEGSPVAIGALTEGDEEQKLEPRISFTVELAALLAEAREGEKVLAELKPALDRLVAQIDGAGPEELPLLEFLRNDRARVLLAERILDLRQEQRRKSDEIMNAVLEDGFMAEGEKLSVKKGRYVDGDGNDSPDQLGAELEGVIAEFNGASREDFARIAERCLDAGVIALFEDRPGTYLLQEFRDRAIAVLADAVRREGIEVFTKTYLTKQGELYIVRPDRAARVEAILKRAEAIAQGR